MGLDSVPHDLFRVPPLWSLPRADFQVVHLPTKEPSLMIINPTSCIDKGLALLQRYEQYGDRSELSAATNYFKSTYQGTPSAYASAYSAALAGFAKANYLESQYLRSLPEARTAVQYQEDALRYTNPESTLYPTRLDELGEYLMAVYTRTKDGREGILQKARAAFEEALPLFDGSDDDDAAWLKCITNLANAVAKSADHARPATAQIARLEDALVIFQEAEKRCPPRQAKWRPWALSQYAQYLIMYTRASVSQESQNDERYDKAVRYAELAYEISQGRILEEVESLSWLSYMYWMSYLRQSNLALLDKTIFTAQKCVDILKRCMPDHGLLRATMPNLATYYVNRFEVTGDHAHIDAAVAFFDDFLLLIDQSEPTTWARYFAAGRAYACRFELTANPQHLDQAINHFRQADELATKDIDRAQCKQYLGCALAERSIHQRTLSDLNKAIDRLMEALDKSEESNKTGAQADLAHALSLRYRTAATHGTDDINRAIELYDQATRKPGLLKFHDVHLSLYGCALQDRWRQERRVEDLERAYQLHRAAVDVAINGQSRRDLFLMRLGTVCRDVYSVFPGHPMGNPLQKSIDTLSEALQLTGRDHPLNAMYQRELAASFFCRFENCHNVNDYAAGLSALRTASYSEGSNPNDRLECSSIWAEMVFKDDPLQALDAYRIALSLLPKVAWRGLEQNTRYRTLHWRYLATDAAACAIAVGKPTLAVELLEQGRAVLWNSSLQLRVEVEQLRKTEPNLARELEDLGKELELSTSRTTMDSGNAPSIRPMVEMKPSRYDELREVDMEYHRNLALAWEKKVEQIRLLPGFENFLRTASYEGLREAGRDGPVVIINISQWRCDALIVTCHHPVRVVPLGCVKKNELETLSNDLHTMLSAAKDEASAQVANTQLVYTLDYLWKHIGVSIWTALKGLLPKQGDGRIWLIPTGSLALLPLHAATSAHDLRSGFPHLVTTSYTSTLSALIRARSNRTTPPQGFRMLAVTQSDAIGRDHLPNLQKEMAAIYNHIPPQYVTTRHGYEATVDAVTDQLEYHNFLHLCCHGHHDFENPYNSGLALHDGEYLRLSTLMSTKLDHAEFAFLSACHTARVDPRAADESVHIASGLYLAGYKSIIATQWGIVDEDGPLVANHVYEYMTRNGRVPDFTEGANALHHAVNKLRDSGTDAFRWVPFVHIGV